MVLTASKQRSRLNAPAELPTSSVTRPAAVRELAANESEVLAATLGERRLAADVPPYLTQVLNTPQGPWYFSRSELTVPPALQDEPLLLLEDSGGAAPRAGKIVLRVFPSVPMGALSVSKWRAAACRRLSRKLRSPLLRACAFARARSKAWR